MANGTLYDIWIQAIDAAKIERAISEGCSGFSVGFGAVPDLPLRFTHDQDQDQDQYSLWLTFIALDHTSPYIHHQLHYHSTSYSRPAIHITSDHRRPSPATPGLVSTALVHFPNIQVGSG